MSEITTAEKILEAMPWRCFQCDFITTNRDEAAAHFGDRDDAEEFKPICKWWANMGTPERVDALQDVLQQLNEERRENERFRVANEGLEWKANSFESEIRSYKPFRKLSTMYQVFCEYDSMEGRALAAEERLNELCKIRDVAAIGEDGNA